MLERTLILLIVTLCFGAGYVALRILHARRLRALQAQGAGADTSPVAEFVASGPALLYFTTDSCAQCRFQQTPILQQLQAQVAALPVVTLDATQRLDLARYFGILTVPSTVLLDGRHMPIAINHGVAPLQKLQLQVENLKVQEVRATPKPFNS